MGILIFPPSPLQCIFRLGKQFLLISRILERTLIYSVCSVMKEVLEGPALIWFSVLSNSVLSSEFFKNIFHGQVKEIQTV